MSRREWSHLYCKIELSQCLSDSSAKWDDFAEPAGMEERDRERERAGCGGGRRRGRWPRREAGGGGAMRRQRWRRPGWAMEEREREREGSRKSLSRWERESPDGKIGGKKGIWGKLEFSPRLIGLPRIPSGQPGCPDSRVLFISGTIEERASPQEQGLNGMSQRNLRKSLLGEPTNREKSFLEGASESLGIIFIFYVVRSLS